MIKSAAVLFVLAFACRAFGEMPYLNGQTFHREDQNITMTFVQQGDQIAAPLVYSGGFNHALTGVWNEKDKAFDCQVTRKNKTNGCVTVMYWSLRPQNANVLLEVCYGTDGICELPTTFRETFVWTLVMPPTPAPTAEQSHWGGQGGAFTYSIIEQDGTFAPRVIEEPGLRTFNSQAEAVAAAKERVRQIVAIMNQNPKMYPPGWMITYSVP